MIATFMPSISSVSKAQNALASEPSIYSLTVGKNYLVAGISFISGDAGSPARVLYQVPNDFGGISHVPASYFNLEDNRCSAYWVARYDVDGSLLLWPKEFFVEYFHDDLSDGIVTVIDIFQEVLGKLNEEAGAGKAGS